MKTVYINENMLKNENFKKSILMDTLPDDIMYAIKHNKTSLGNNPSIPDIFDEPFLLKITEDGFKEAKEELKKIGEISDIDETELEPALAKLLLICKKIETPFRSKLEKICLNYIIDLFDIPEETIDISLNLCDKVDMSNIKVNVEPNNIEYEHETIDDILTIKNEINKRRLLKTLCVGASMRMANGYEYFENELNEINPDLIDLYKKIVSLNTYILYTKNDFGIDDKNKMQLGIVTVSLGDNNTKVKIDAQGVILPILITEAIKGIMELFISHGLPKDLEITNLILDKTEFLKSEPWEMKLGPKLWDLFFSSLKESNTDILPYLLKRVSEIETNKFHRLFREIFSKTRKGKRIMSNFLIQSKQDIEYDKFVDRMTKKNIDKGIITDDYIHPGEL